MNQQKLNKHISGQFNAELEEVRNQVLVMGGLVEQQLSDAITAMHKQDLDLARQTVARDQEVNGLEVEIAEDCTRIIAKRQPAASDLRLVLVVLKTITDLERIGDAAKRISRMVIDNADQTQPPLVSIENMGRRAVSMLHQGLDAFARMDLTAAIAVHKQDSQLNRDYESIVRELMTFMMEDPRSIPQVLKVLWCVRSLERVGDRVQHLCEYIIYFVKGKDVRHRSDEDIYNLLD